MFDTENDDREVISREGHDPEVRAILETEGAPTEAQTSSLLAEAGYAEDALAEARGKAPETADARGDALTRRVAALVRRPDGGRLGETAREVASWAAVQDEYGTYRDAEQRVADIEHEKGLEDRQADDVVAAQLREGKPAKAPAGTDWVMELRTRRAVVRVSAEVLAAARTAYDKVVVAETPKRSTAAIARLKAAEKSMRELAPAALASVSEFLAAREVAVEVVEAADDWRADLGVMSAEARSVLSAASRAVPALRALVSSEHPVVSGHHLFEKFSTDAPPLHVREWLAESDGGAAALAAIERRESKAGEEVSRLVRGRWVLVHPEELRRGVEWRPSRLRAND